MNGFERKTRVEIVEDMQAKARNLFGNNVNLQTNSPLGILIQLVSYPMSLLWFGLENIYNAMDINTADGQDLDNLAKKIGIQRFSSQKAVGEVTFTGDNLTIIPENFQVETDEEVPKVYETTEEVVISGGSATAEIISVEGGSEYNVTAGTITETTEVLSGIDSVTNSAETIGGRDRETDSELRERYLASLDKTGGSTTNAIRAKILEDTDASDCIVLENVTLTTDANGLPAKSVEAIVYGGTDEDIATAILNSKAGGIETSGDETYLITDSSGQEQTINFERATPVDIFVDITIEKDANYEGDTELENEIIGYVESLLINQDVIYQKFVDVAFNIDGVTDVTALAIDTSDNPTATDNITIGFREVADISTAEIVINYA